MPKLIFVTLIVASLFNSTSFASTQTERLFKSKAFLGVVYEDTSIGEKCLMTSNQALQESVQYAPCNSAQQAEVIEFDALPKNPETALVGSIVAGVIEYYVLCTAIQYAPKLFEVFDDRTAFEKARDLFAPSEARRDTKKLQETVENFSEGVSKSVCFPATAANKKLTYLFE